MWEYNYSDEEYLSHAGKKGMKWGYNDGQRNGNAVAGEGISEDMSTADKIRLATGRMNATLGKQHRRQAAKNYSNKAMINPNMAHPAEMGPANPNASRKQKMINLGIGAFKGAQRAIYNGGKSAIAKGKKAVSDRIDSIKSSKGYKKHKKKITKAYKKGKKKIDKLYKKYKNSAFSKSIRKTKKKIDDTRKFYGLD